MDQSVGSPSMRGILSAGNWKILYSTPGRSIAKAQTERAKNSEIAVTRGAVHFMNTQRLRGSAFIVFTCLQTSVMARTGFSKNSSPCGVRDERRVPSRRRALFPFVERQKNPLLLFCSPRPLH